jgi:hypothetical protein
VTTCTSPTLLTPRGPSASTWIASAVLSGMKTGIAGCCSLPAAPAGRDRQCALRVAARRYPDVAWRYIRAFRNLAVHRYFVVDWAVVWQISQEEVPVLEEQVMGIMRGEFPELAKTYESDAVSGPEGTAGPSPEDAA